MFQSRQRRYSHGSGRDNRQRRALSDASAARDPRRSEAGLLQHARARRETEAAGPARAGGRPGPRGRLPRLRRPQGKGRAGATRVLRLQAPHRAHHGGDGPVGAYSRARLKAHAGRPGEAELPNIVARELGGRALRTRIVSDPACVRVGSKRNHACLLVDLRNREIAGHAAGGCKGASLVKPAFAAAALPLTDIRVLHADRGGESGSIAIDDLLGAFGIEGSPSGKGCPCGSAVDEPASKMPKAEPVYGESFSTLHGLQVKLNDHVR